MARDRIQQLGFGARLFVNRGSSEKARTQRGIPMDVMPSTHLIFEESREKQALRSRRFQHQTVVRQGGIQYEMVEDRAETGGHR